MIKLSKQLKICLFFLLTCTLVFTGMASAHQDPPGNFIVGDPTSIRVFRDNNNNGIFDAGDSAVTSSVADGETITSECILAPNTLGGEVAIERGAITFIDPDGNPTNRTPAGGIPCIGGTANDGDALGDPTLGLNCAGSPARLIAQGVAVQIDCADAQDGVVNFTCNYSGGAAHSGL